MHSLTFFWTPPSPCRQFSVGIRQLTQISGTLHNTGQSLVFRVERDSKLSVNISGGPLAYRYQFEEIYIHYGTENNQGSEHQIHGYTFPGEVSYLRGYVSICLPVCRGKSNWVAVNSGDAWC